MIVNSIGIKYASGVMDVSHSSTFFDLKNFEVWTDDQGDRVLVCNVGLSDELIIEMTQKITNPVVEITATRPYEPIEEYP